MRAVNSFSGSDEIIVFLKGMTDPYLAYLTMNRMQTWCSCCHQNIYKWVRTQKLQIALNDLLAVGLPTGGTISSEIC